MSSNRSTQQPPTSSAISQINSLKPIDDGDAQEDITQRPVGGGEQSNRQPDSMMKEIDPKSTRQNVATKDAATKSEMVSVMGNSTVGSVMGNSTMGSVINPVDLNHQPEPNHTPQQEPSDSSTVFVKTKAVSRPAIVREPNNWVKRQTVDMTRSVPLGVQPTDPEAKKLLHSHTGVPSRTTSKTAVSAAPASSPTPLLPLPIAAASTSNTKNNNTTKNEGSELPPNGEQQQFQARRKSSGHQTAREKKSVHQVRTKRSVASGVSKSAPSSPNPTPPSTAAAPVSSREAISGAGAAPSSSKEKESFFSKFAKKLLPSSSKSNPGGTGTSGNAPIKSKSTTSIYERKQSKPKEKK